MKIYLQNLSLFIFFLFLIFSYEKENDDINKNTIQENQKLLFVWEHFRHGARDPYIQVDPITWIDFIGVQWKSQGELNSIGLRSHYLLGAATKKKYNDFLSETFDPNEIFIISTDVNRTIVSAMANLQGIYNNLTTQNLTENQINLSKINNLNETYQNKINEKINELKAGRIQNGINIIPIHIFSKLGLQFKLNDEAYCPGIKKYKDEAKNLEKVKEILNDFYKYTNDSYGENIFEFMNVSVESDPRYIWEDSNLYYICDSYIADYVFGREMPHIKNTGIDMEEFYYHCLNHSFIDTYYVNYGLPPTKASYLTVSPMFRSIFNYMDRRIYINEHNDSKEINSSSPKFVIYSGHDSTVGAVDVFLKNEFNISYENPEYTTSQIFELWQIDNEYHIRYLYNQKEKAIYKYNDFKMKTLDKLLSQNQVEEECFGNNRIIEKENIFKRIFLIIIGIAIVLFLLLISLILLEKKRKYNN